MKTQLELETEIADLKRLVKKLQRALTAALEMVAKQHARINKLSQSAGRAN